MSRTRSRNRRGIAIAGAAIGALMLIAPAAQAGPLVASAPDCAEEPVTQPFAPWLDPMSYQFAPDGGFESGGEGWQLGGADVVAGNESHYVHDSGDTSSLRLRVGDSAISPTVCVGLEHPTIRFFTKKANGLLAAATVEVLFETAGGTVLSAPIGVATGGGSWQPSLPLPIVANLLPLLPGDHTPVRFRFTPLLGGIQIDDLYVDPRRNS